MSLSADPTVQKLRETVAEIDRIEKELHTLQTQVKDKNTELKTLSSKVIELESKRTDLSNQISSLDSEHTDKSARLNTISQELANKEQEKNQFDENLTDIQREVNDLNAKREKAKEEITDFSSQKEVLEKKLKAAQDRYKEEDARFSALYNTNKELEYENDNIQNKIDNRKKLIKNNIVSLYSANVSFELLETIPESEIRKYVSIGTLIILTATFAIISSGYALYTVFVHIVIFLLEFSRTAGH